MHDFMGSPWGWLVDTMVAIFWSLLIVATILYCKSWLEQKPDRHSDRDEESTLELLSKRYARGEISKEEFEEKCKDLL